MFSQQRLLLMIALFALLVLPANLAFAELRVVSSLPDYAAIAKAVGGEHANVDSLAGSSVDPHHVDPRPNLILSLNKADLLIVNGLELESAWLDPLVKQARNPKINPGSSGYFVAAEHASLIEVPQGAIDRAEGDIHPGGNPHFYFDPTSAISIANALAKRMGELDGKNADAYRANAKKFTNRLWSLAKKHALQFARLPESDRQVVSYHKSLGYVYRWLKLTEVMTVEPKPGIPPNPKHVAKVLSTMKTKKIGVIVQEEFYPRKTSDTLAKLADARMVVLPGATRFDDGQSYLEHVDQIAEALYAAVSE